MKTREIIFKYWKSWQSHSGWEETRKLMKHDFKFDAGFNKTETADELIKMMKNGNPWKDIRLLDILTNGKKGAIFYEGIGSIANEKIRIAEILTVESGKVAC